ncbi:hypothetical protein AB205_0088290 [Aquarana catesbeiana]|uniref:Uncharacterized protein n=1 Tax=Aquarana catesbeiana TaxID=8400 RepID=A0A2G9RQG3_AQUCT|nr:hypothetical protein AB205_0088290 [Aquarana catesbeiana]
MFLDIPFCLEIVFSSFNREAPKKEAPAKPQQGKKGGYPRSGTNRGGNKVIFPQKIKKKKCSMVEFTSQEQTLTSYQVQEESECGQLTQDVSLEPWDLTPGPSTDIAIVVIKSPDVSHSEGQSEPEEEESIWEPLVYASHNIPLCTIGRMSADMLHCLKDLEQIKEAATALQRTIRFCGHACQI